MSVAAELRLPGVYFLPPPAAGPGLPALDVAGFVGFAERGPVDVPVPLADASAYAAVFGGDLPLAREHDGKTVYAALPSAVAAFFANGGRRCYVVRVAGRAARPARVRLPGLVAIDASGDAIPATTVASSPGRWANDLRLATRLSITPLPSSAFAVLDEARLSWLAGPAPQAIEPGDVLRLTFADGRQWLYPVTAVSPGAGRALPTEVAAASAWELLTGLPPGESREVAAVERLSAGWIDAVPTAGPLVAGESPLPLALSLPEGAGVRRGDLLRLRLEDGSALLFPVAEVTPPGQVISPLGPPPRAMAEAALLLPARPLPAGSPGEALHAVERLRLDVYLRLGQTRRAPLLELGFNAGHARYWGDAVLLESSSLYRQSFADAGTLGGLAPVPGGARRAASAGADTPAAREAQLYRKMIGGKRSQPSRDGQPDAVALAGLLAPVDEPTGGGPGPVASTRTYLPLGMPSILAERDFAAPDAPGDDDLDTFGRDQASLFLDPYLVPYPRNQSLTAAGLMAEAFDRYYVQDRRLLGLHALLFVDEVALLSVPDAAQRPWSGRAPTEPAQLQLEPAPTLPEPCPPLGPFERCLPPPTVEDVTPSAGALAGGTRVTIQGAGFSLQSVPEVRFGGKPATSALATSPTELSVVTPPGASPGPVTVSVTTPLGTGQKLQAFTYREPPTMPELPVAEPADEFDLDGSPLLAVQKGMLTLCQARGDVVGVCVLPRHFAKRQCLDWQQGLRASLGLPLRGSPGADLGLLADLSYLSVYHPWLFVADPTATGQLRAIPPDGVACGTIAARERERQVWVAPANLPLSGVLGLTPDLSTDDWADLFALQFNVAREEPRDFKIMSAHTLSDERALLQLSVRRLLILLKKLAYERGLDFVFEPNHERFRDGIRLMLEAVLRSMFERGAFAGRTAAGAFRVVTDATVNTPESVDQGQFVAQIQVAPSQPMEFITVLLTRTGEGQLQATEV